MWLFFFHLGAANCPDRYSFIRRWLSPAVIGAVMWSILLLGGFVAFSFFIGVLMGVVGIGGVLLIPYLVYFGGFDIHVVIPACMAGFVVTGWVAAYCYARQGSIRWDKALYLLAGAAPGAYVGSVTVWALPPLALEIIVASFVLLSGANALLNDRGDSSGAGVERVSGVALTALGLAVGYGSSVSGTGGPLLLIPSLLLLNFPVLVAVGLGMAVQLVIAPFATLSHFMHGSIDWLLAAPIALGVSAGIILGAKVAHRLSAHVLRRIVAVALVICGLSLALKFIIEAI